MPQEQQQRHHGHLRLPPQEQLPSRARWAGGLILCQDYSQPFRFHTEPTVTQSPTDRHRLSTVSAPGEEFPYSVKAALRAGRRSACPRFAAGRYASSTRVLLRALLSGNGPDGSNGTGVNTRVQVSP